MLQRGHRRFFFLSPPPCPRQIAGPRGPVCAPHDVSQTVGVGAEAVSDPDACRSAAWILGTAVHAGAATLATAGSYTDDAGTWSSVTVITPHPCNEGWIPFD
jgi:hypothetical protein